MFNVSYLCVILLPGDNMLTALSVARDSGMVSTNDRVLLLTAQYTAGDVEQKLSLQWSPIADMHNCYDMGQDMINEDDAELRRVLF